MSDDRPPWAQLIRERREAKGRSIRAAAMAVGVSDSYWSQVERGYQTSKGNRRPIRPSRATILQIAESLRLSNTDTNQLMKLLEYAPVTGRETPTPEDIDMRGLRRSDVALLRALADRLRHVLPEERPADQVETPPRRLRAVAAERPKRSRARKGEQEEGST